MKAEDNDVVVPIYKRGVNKPQILSEADGEALKAWLDARGSQDSRLCSPRSSVHHCQILEGSGNAEVWQLFLEELFEKLASPGYTIISDNASVHRILDTNSCFWTEAWFPVYAKIFTASRWNWGFLSSVEDLCSSFLPADSRSAVRSCKTREWGRYRGSKPYYFKNTHENCLKIIAGVTDLRVYK